MAKKEETSTAVQTSTAIPAYMQRFMQQSQNDAGAMAASSVSVPRLSIKGKRFCWKKDGEDDLVKALTVDVVIVGVEPEAGKMIKTFYEKDYEPGSSDPPDCSSSNGIYPDSWVSNPVNPTCGNCPNNVFGSATSKFSGKKTKKCSDSKRLWVTKPDDLSCAYGLGVPVTSLKNLSEYGKYIAKNGMPLALMITTLGFDDESEFAKITFEHKGFLPEELAEEAINLNSDRPWRTDFSDRPMLPDHSTDGGRTVATPAEGVKPIAGGTPTGGATIDQVVGSW